MSVAVEMIFIGMGLWGAAIAAGLLVIGAFGGGFGMMPHDPPSPPTMKEER